MPEAYTKELWAVIDSEGDSVEIMLYDSREEAEKGAQCLAEEDEANGPFTVYALKAFAYYVRGTVKRVPVCREAFDHA